MIPQGHVLREVAGGGRTHSTLIIQDIDVFIPRTWLSQKPLKASAMTKRNLILIHRGSRYEKDFEEIAATVNAIDQNITVYHLPANQNIELPPAAWQHPTLTVALMSMFRLAIKRGGRTEKSPD